MNLSSTDRALLTLVRSGLWEKSPDDPESLVVLDEEQWKAVVSASKSQTVEGLVWRGLSNTEEENQLPPDAILAGMAVDVDRIERRNAMVSAEAGKLFAAYEAKGLHPVLLKGPASAALYEHPEVRVSGDIDIFFPEEEFRKAVPAGADKESDGAYVFVSNGITVELHPQILDVASGKNDAFIRNLQESEGFSQIDGGLRTPGPLMTMLLLDSHVLKHCIGRGVGLRQCCDYARARQILGYDRVEFEKACKTLGLGAWTEVFGNFCDSFLQRDEASGTSSRLAQKLLDRVLRDGNFGRNATAAGSGLWGTVGAFASHMGFSLRVAPRETAATVLALAHGRLADGMD